MDTVAAGGSGSIEFVSNPTYDDLAKKAKENIEEWIQTTVDYALELMTEGRDVYGAADLAASRMEIDFCHGEILRRLMELKE